MLFGRERLRERWDTVNGLQIFSRVSKLQQEPQNARIVLIHALGVSSRYMTPLANELARNYSVYVPDLPGFGRSENPGHVLGIVELAKALRDWLRVIQAGPSLFVGNSMGCQILVELAYLDPSGILGTAFLGPTMDQHAWMPISHVVRLLMDQFREPASLIPLQALDYLSNGPIRTIKTFRKALKHNMLERAAQVKAPCLIVRGEHDPIVSERCVEELASLMPNAETRTVAGAGHALNYNSARKIVPEMIHFWRAYGLTV